MWMLAVVFLLTAAVLILVQARMRRHVREDLVSTLKTQSNIFAEFEKLRREKTEQTAALIANQSSLKALMSTNDRATVDDGSAGILETSHADLLLLEGPSGDLLAFHSKSDDVPVSAIKRQMQNSTGDADWWFVGGRLYDVSFRQITAGAAEHSRVLGRMALGREVSRHSVLAGGALGKSGFVFERGGAVMLSSLPAGAWSEFEASLPQSPIKAADIREVDLEGERYLGNFVELSGDHPVHLFCLQSFDQATSFLKSLNRVLVILGAVAVMMGAGLAFILSRQITRPLETLAAGTRQMEKGDFEFQIPVQGTDEVADLARAFEEMRTTLRQSREGLLRAARLEAVGRLAGGIAHDFNNLVMIIKGYSDLLMESATPENRPYLDEIKSAGERASGLTRQLLAFSRKQVLEPQILDPSQAVRNMVKMLRVLIGEDVELVTNFSEHAARVKADPGQLEQVVMNLAVNARDAMPGGGKIVIETQSCYLDASYSANNAEVVAGNYVLIAVTDTGCGMDKETLSHIFEPFFTTKELGKGTGLGLATVYGIVKQSHGHVSVYSEPGVGTTFKIYLPAVQTAVQEKAVLPAALAPKGDGTILLVEDEPPLRALAAESLKRLGYTVLQASNGAEALSMIEQHTGKLDLVITDIVMPRMGGPELVEKLKQKRQDFKVIFMSGYTEAAALENANIGTNAMLLNKPFSNELLARRVQEVQESAPTSSKAAVAGNSI